MQKASKLGSDRQKSQLPQQPRSPRAPLLPKNPSAIDAIILHNKRLQVLGVDAEACAVLSQNSEHQAWLSRLIRSDPPRIEPLGNAAKKAHEVRWTTDPTSGDIKALCGLCAQLMKNEDPAALHWLVSVGSKALTALSDSDKRDWLQACAKALRQFPQVGLSGPSLTAFAKSANACLEAGSLGLLSKDVKLLLALPHGARAKPKAAPAVNKSQEARFAHYAQFDPKVRLTTLLGWLGADSDQRKTVLSLDSNELHRRDFLWCFTGGTPPIMVSENADPLEVLVTPPTDRHALRTLIKVIDCLCEQAIPGAAAVSAALCLALKDTQQEAAMLNQCGNALLSSMARLAKGQFRPLCLRVLELASKGQLGTEVLRAFERVAAFRQKPKTCIELRRQRLRLEIQGLENQVFSFIESQDRPADVNIPSLLNDIQSLHKEMRAQGLSDSGTHNSLSLMRHLLGVCKDESHAALVKSAIADLLRDQATAQNAQQGPRELLTEPS